MYVCTRVQLPNSDAPPRTRVVIWFPRVNFDCVLQASRLTVERTTSPKTMLPKEELKFGATFADHMLEVDWVKGKGWDAPKIKPFQNLSISPAASVLHYALEAFEGMKVRKSFRAMSRIQQMSDTWVVDLRTCTRLL